jgi:hypothetical protein
VLGCVLELLPHHEGSNRDLFLELALGEREGGRNTVRRASSTGRRKSCAGNRASSTGRRASCAGNRANSIDRRASSAGTGASSQAGGLVLKCVLELLSHHEGTNQDRLQELALQNDGGSDSVCLVVAQIKKEDGASLRLILFSLMSHP